MKPLQPMSGVLPASLFGLSLAWATGNALSATAGAADARERSTWDGVYASAQADRGRGLLDRHCSQCHAPNLKGSQAAPAIVGPEFLYFWEGRTLGELLLYLRSTMPPGQAGTLSDAEYADIIAEMLRVSGFPSHPDEAPAGAAAALGDVVIRRQDPDEEP